MKRFILSSLALIVLLFGCRQNPLEQSSTNDVDEEVSLEPIIIDDTVKVVKSGTAFKDPFVEGNLYYTVDESKAYQDLTQAGIEKEALIAPHNLYHSQDMGERYQKISDFIQEDGSVVETHQLIILDVTIRNENALGLTKKNEFNIVDLSLYGGNPVTRYYIAYFSESGKVDEAQPLHYELEQGQEIKVQLAYLVLQEDVESLVGMINETQFSIY